MKIQKVELKEVEVVEVDGEFEKRFINTKVHPAFLTNFFDDVDGKPVQISEDGNVHVVY
ncbi:hypothetical protein [Lysinibacillus sp. NPDC056232]|uniref:hypothetical protein n=1 Tax=Lysinibacillus sp. NPDC056232 TaxID=3345756 RepID=UPI0035DDB034